MLDIKLCAFKTVLYKKTEKHESGCLLEVNEATLLSEGQCCAKNTLKMMKKAQEQGPHRGTIMVGRLGFNGFAAVQPKTNKI